MSEGLQQLLLPVGLASGLMVSSITFRARSPYRFLTVFLMLSFSSVMR